MDSYVPERYSSRRREAQAQREADYLRSRTTFGIACPHCVFMVRELPTRDAVRIAYGQHTCVEPMPKMDEITWIQSGRGWYLRGSDAGILDGDRLTCRHCDKTVVDEKLVGHWDIAQDWLLIHALDCKGSTGPGTLGYVEGRNLILERRSAEGRFERFAPIVAELVSLNVDVIVVTSTPLAQRAREVTTAVPIILGAGTDFVGAGLAQSLARPGGNVTGLTLDVGPEIQGKRLELLKGAVPRASRVAFLGTKKLWDVVYEKSIKAGAQALGLTVFLAENTPTEYTGAFTLISRERADALFVAPSSENYAQRRLIVDFTTSNRLPSIHAFREAVEVGGLISYGANVADLLRRAAGYVDKILKGAKPGDLPVEQPTKFELVVNLKTAKALGLTIPPSLLQRADQVIE